MTAEQHRIERVRKGSRRKRDLQAAREAEARRARDAMGELEREAEAREAWDVAMQLVRQAIPATIFSMWIDPLRPLGASGGVLWVEAPDMVRSWVQRRYRALIVQALRQVSDFEQVTLVSPAVAA